MKAFVNRVARWGAGAPGVLLAGLLLLSGGAFAGVPAYPIVFVHGLGGSSLSWTRLDEGPGVVEHLQENLGWGTARTVHLCLNQANGTAVFGEDGVADYPGIWHDDDVRCWSDLSGSGSLYLVNFHVDRAGEFFSDIGVEGQSESHAAAIVKQGYGLGIAIQKVLEATGARKVVLVGVSMGGLAIREYLQRRLQDGSHPWWARLPGDASPHHHVAKVITIGTPHGGAPLANWTSLVGPGAMRHSEACRDLTDWDDADPAQRKTGIYLFGGLERNVDTSGMDYWFNADVTCNGVADDLLGPAQAYLPLNNPLGPPAAHDTMPLPSDLEFFYVVGNANALGNDGIVSVERAFLPGSPPVGEMKIINAWHHPRVRPPDQRILLDDHQTLIGALDEADFEETAYELTPQRVVDGFVTVQESSGSTLDWDYFKLQLPARLPVRLSVSNYVGTAGRMVLFDPTGQQVDNQAIVGGSAVMGGTFDPGTYVVRLQGTASLDSHSHPYHLYADLRPYLDWWQVRLGEVELTDGMQLEPMDGRALQVRGRVGGNVGDLEQVQVGLNGQLLASGSSPGFDFSVPVPGGLRGALIVSVIVRDTDGTFRSAHRSFFILPAGDTVYLDPKPRFAARGSYQDLPLYVNSRGKPLGALSFQVSLDPPSGVAQFAGAYPLWGAGAGGLQVLDNPGSYSRGTNMPVIAINSMRPDVMRGEQTAFMLRFLVNGVAGDVCRIQLSDVVAVTTAAVPQTEIPGAGAVPTKKFIVDTSGGLIVVADHPRGGVRLDGLPAEFKRHHLYPLRLVVDGADKLVTGLDCTLHFPPDVFRVVEVEPTALFLGLTVARNQFTNGIVRIIGVNGSSLSLPRGEFDAATIWLDVNRSAPRSSATLWLLVNALYTEAGEMTGQLHVPHAWERTVWVGYPEEVQVQLTPPPPEDVVTGAVLETVVQANTGLWGPSMIGGQIEYDPQQVRIAAVTPLENFATGLLTIDPRSFASGLTPFFVSQTVPVLGPFGDWQPVAMIRWQVIGQVLEGGSISVTVTAAADGIANGLDACLSTAANRFPFQIKGAPGDLDGDGLPDWWETIYFGDATGGAPSEDSDDDGMTNEQEFRTGTDPRRSESLLRITDAWPEPGAGLGIKWTSAPERRYRVARSPAVLGGFETVAGNLAATPPLNSWVDRSVRSGSQFFYRIELEP